MIKSKITVEVGGIWKVIKFEDWVGLGAAKGVCM